jgi:hypothetical protein
MTAARNSKAKNQALPPPAGPDYHGCGPARAYSQQADHAAWHGIERQSLGTRLLAYGTRPCGYGGARRRGARGSGDSVTEARVIESLEFGGVEWRVAAPRLGATRPTLLFLLTPLWALSLTPSLLTNSFHLSSFLTDCFAFSFRGRTIRVYVGSCGSFAW